MITKNDCMTILVKLGDQGLEVNQYIRKLMLAQDIPVDVLRFISKNRGIEIANFYEVLRKSHNKNKSPLYTNIVKDQQEIGDAVVTLSSMLTQIALYARKLDDLLVREQFIKESRAEEITRVLNTWYTAEDSTSCLNLLQLIKTDLLVLEYIAGRRDLVQA